MADIGQLADMMGGAGSGASAPDQGAAVDSGKQVEKSYTVDKFTDGTFRVSGDGGEPVEMEDAEAVAEYLGGPKEAEEPESEAPGMPGEGGGPNPMDLFANPKRFSGGRGR